MEQSTRSLSEERRRQTVREYCRKLLAECKPLPIKDMVYLQDDKFTYEFFLTGNLNAEQRDREIE